MDTNKLLVMFFTAALLSSCSQTLWINKNLNSIKPNINKVTIIFPEIEFREKTGEATEIKPAHSVFVSKTVAEAFKETIDEGNFIPKYAITYCDTPLVGKWIQNHFSTASVKYKQMKDSVRLSQNSTKIIPVNQELRSLLDKANSDYVMIITGLAYGTSNQTKQHDILQLQTFELLYDHAFPYNYQWSGLELQISLVDAKSMEVLWYNYNDENASKYNPFKKEDVKDLCLKLLKQK
jgi:hypothetical protein